MFNKANKLSSGNVKDLCHATPYICTSSNPTGGILIKFFHIKILGFFFFMCFFIIFVCCLFVFCFDFFLYCISWLCVFFFFFFFFIFFFFF